MANIGYASLQIVPSFQGIQSSLSSGMVGPAGTAGGQAGKAFGGNFKKIALGLMTAVAAKKFIDFLGGAVDEAIEAQKVERQTAAVLKSTGGAAGVTSKQITKYATELSKLAGIDDETIQASENMLLSFKEVHADVFPRATKAILDTASAFAAAHGSEVDLAGTTLQVGKALNDPIKGLTSLVRVGATFNQTQKDQIRWMVATGDLAGAQKIILGELESEFKGSAAAQATAGQKLKVAYDNLKETIGTALLPVISKIATVTQRVVTWLTKHRTVALVLAGVIGGTLLAVLAAYTVSMISAAAATIAATWPILAIIAAVTAVIAIIVLVATKWDAIWNWIKNHPAYAAIIAVILAIVAPITLVAFAIGALAAHWSEVWGWIKQAASDAWNFINSNVIEPIKGGINTMVSVVSGAFDILKEAWAAVGAAFGWVWDNVIKPIVNAVKDAWDFITGFGSNPTSPQAPRKPGQPFGSGPGQVNAHGGTAFGFSWVGEMGGKELAFFPQPTRIFSHAQSQTIASAMRQRDGKPMQMTSKSVHLNFYGYNEEQMIARIRREVDDFDADVDMDLAANGM